MLKYHFNSKRKHDRQTDTFYLFQRDKILTNDSHMLKYSFNPNETDREEGILRK